MFIPPISRRALLQGSAATAIAAALAGASTGTALAAPYDRYDTVEAYERAWREVNLQPNHNEAGQVAWILSYGMLSLVRMWQATGDDKYLDRFVHLADGVWDNTDHARGVTDFRGRSERVWRAGGNYAAAGVSLVDADGRALFGVRYAHNNPTEGRVTVSNVADGQFDLTLQHPSASTVTVTGMNLNPDSPDYVVTRVAEDGYWSNRRWTAEAYGVMGVPVETTAQLERRFNVFSVHTGMATYPMVLFSRMVIQHRLNRYRGKAQQYLAWSRHAARYHDDEFEFSTLADGTRVGDFRFVKGSPAAWDGLIQPSNQSHGLGQTYVELARLRGEYADRVTAMVAAFRHRDAEEVGGALHWTYWPRNSELYNGFTAAQDLSTYTPWNPANRSYEDVSHAAITVEFMNAAREAGLGATEDDLRRLSATYMDDVRRDEDRVWTRVNGTQEAAYGMAAQVGRWLPLQRLDERMADHVESVYQELPLEPEFGSHLLVMSYLVWARQEGWRRN